MMMLNNGGYVPDHDKVLLSTIKESTKILRFQSKNIVNHLFKVMKEANTGKDSIGWNTFKYLAGDLVPRTLKEKIDMFLEAFTPTELRP